MKRENINKKRERKIKREKWRIGPLPRIRPINAFDPRGPITLLPLRADMWGPTHQRPCLPVWLTSGPGVKDTPHPGTHPRRLCLVGRPMSASSLTDRPHRPGSRACGRRPSSALGVQESVGWIEGRLCVTPI
jgi:hypothetical protein